VPFLSQTTPLSVGVLGPALLRVRKRGLILKIYNSYINAPSTDTVRLFPFRVFCFPVPTPFLVDKCEYGNRVMCVYARKKPQSTYLGGLAGGITSAESRMVDS
jgi:hypothetical protein